MIQLLVPFVLASQSPRRREMLSRLGLDFEVVPSQVNEDVDDNSSPGDIVALLALRKALDVAEARPEALVLGSDTIVVLDESILGKPADIEEAQAMLRRLSGRTHTVYSGIALVHSASDREVSIWENTEVTFGDLSDGEIGAYVRTGSPMDKAGSYGIQDDLGALLIDRIDGDYYNVVGLPLRRLYLTLNSNFPDLLVPL